MDNEEPKSEILPTEFEIGQEVTCINDTPKTKHREGTLFPIELDKQYVIRDLKTCDCGIISLDIGLHAPIGSRCGECNFLFSDTLPYFDSRRFKITKSKEDVMVILEQKRKEQIEHNEREIAKGLANVTQDVDAEIVSEDTKQITEEKSETEAK